jgi:hypothetical protein
MNIPQNAPFVESKEIAMSKIVAFRGKGKAAGQVGRHRLRDRTLILVAYRLKNGSPSTHPIEGDELRLLRRLQREHPIDCAGGGHKKTRYKTGLSIFGSGECPKIHHNFCGPAPA